MNSHFEHYVEKIVNQTECTTEEKEDIAEELLSHLEQSRDELMIKGMNKEEAELAAMEFFGSEGEIGSGIRQALFPFRKELMLALSLLSLMLTISAYLLLLFLEGDARIGWLVVSLGMSSFLLVMTLHPIANVNRKRWINGLLIIHVLTYLYGYGLISSLEHSTSLPLMILNLMMILLSLYLIYQTTINDSRYEGELAKKVKVIHRLNLASGVIVIGSTLFLLWIGLFLFEGYNPRVLLMMLPFFLWILFYTCQLKMIHKSKRITIFMGVFSVVMALFLLIVLFSPVLI